MKKRPLSEEELIRCLQAMLDKPGNIHGNVRLGTKADDNAEHQGDPRPRLVFELNCCSVVFGNREMILKLTLSQYRIILRYSMPECHQCISEDTETFE